MNSLARGQPCSGCPGRITNGIYVVRLLGSDTILCVFEWGAFIPICYSTHMSHSGPHLCYYLDDVALFCHSFVLSLSLLSSYQPIAIYPGASSRARLTPMPYPAKGLRYAHQAVFRPIITGIDLLRLLPIFFCYFFYFLQ